MILFKSNFKHKFLLYNFLLFSSLFHIYIINLLYNFYDRYISKNIKHIYRRNMKLRKYIFTLIDFSVFRFKKINKFNDFLFPQLRNIYQSIMSNAFKNFYINRKESFILI